MTARNYATIAIVCAACFGCTGPTSPDRVVESPPIDRLFIYARNWPTEEVELALIREGGESTLTLFRPARDGRPRTVLDSIGPVQQDPQRVREMLKSFDVWALNAPNATGAACTTVNGQRSCTITVEDYSLVMRVERGGEVRVQRYTGLETSTGNQSARALGDFVLEWAREREGPGESRQDARGP